MCLRLLPSKDQAQQLFASAPIQGPRTTALCVCSLPRTTHNSSMRLLSSKNQARPSVCVCSLLSCPPKSPSQIRVPPTAFSSVRLLDQDDHQLDAFGLQEARPVLALKQGRTQAVKQVLQQLDLVDAVGVLALVDLLPVASECRVRDPAQGTQCAPSLSDAPQCPATGRRCRSARRGGGG